MIGPMITTVVTPLALLLQTTPASPGQMTPDQQFQIAREALRHDPSSTGLLVPISLFAMIVLIVWLGGRYKQARIRAQAEVRKQVLDKFGSAQELAAFMESKGGQEFLGLMDARASGHLRFVPGGLVTTMLGLGFLGLTLMHRSFLVPAVLLLALGVGLLLSGVLVHKLASKKNNETVSPGPGAQSFPPA